MLTKKKINKKYVHVEIRTFTIQIQDNNTIVISRDINKKKCFVSSFANKIQVVYCVGTPLSETSY